MAVLLRAILVPLDGSALGEQALPYALALARASGATLHLVHAAARYASRVGIPAPAARRTAEQQLEGDAHAYLHGVAERAGRILPEQIHLEVVRTRRIPSPYGEAAAVADALARVARRLSPGLLIMTTNARGGLSRLWLGSVADTLIRRGVAPMLLIRPREQAIVSDPVFHHVLAALDGSPLAEQSLPLVASIAALCNAQLTLLRVIVPRLVIARPAPVTRLDSAHLAEQESDAARYLDATAERLRPMVPRTATATLVAAQPARAILHGITEWDVDLVAISTRGVGGMQRIMLGSVADKVVRGAPVPVLLTTAAPAGGAR